MTAPKEIVPSWVYSMADYCQMFDLQKDDLKLSLLDFPAGISSFNAEMHAQGHKVCSGDTSYHLTFPEMQKLSKKILQANEDYIKQHEAIMRTSESIKSVFEAWEERCDLFLGDYEEGKEEGRYQFMELPNFPFDDHAFDIALCSDHLFYPESVSIPQQEEIIAELSRVAKEVRVFPLLNNLGKVAESLGQVMLNCQQKGYGIEVREVPYHQMKGGNAILRIWSNECVVES